jgi:hypothetical protein
MVLYSAFNGPTPDDLSVSGLSPLFGFQFENFVVGWFRSTGCKAAETAFQSFVDIRSLVSNIMMKKVSWWTLPSGRIMFANKLQESGKSLQNRQPERNQHDSDEQDHQSNRRRIIRI